MLLPVFPSEPKRLVATRSSPSRVFRKISFARSNVFLARLPLRSPEHQPRSWHFRENGRRAQTVSWLGTTGTGTRRKSSLESLSRSSLLSASREAPRPPQADGYQSSIPGGIPAKTSLLAHGGLLLDRGSPGIERPLPAEARH